MDNILNHCKKHSDHSEGFGYLYDRILEKARIFKDYPFIEIGTREGGSALLFLEAIKNTSNFLITIDPYGKSYLAGGQWPPIGDNFYRNGQKLIADYCLQNGTLHIPFRLTSDDFMMIWPKINLWINGNTCKKEFGVVYLDGEHTEETVLRELNWFLPRTNAEGLIIIDDISYLNDAKIDQMKEIIKNGLTRDNRLYITNWKLN